uniref:Arf-GAP domain-containing protein n=1 Tax=Cyprinus carpio TaxID=7962 RepID=A0A8C2FM45_CYPCA
MRAEPNKTQNVRSVLQLFPSPELSNAVSDVCVCVYPEWGSCSLGVFVCLGCSGIHRSIPNLGKVKSLLLSRWEDSEVQVLFRK